MSYAYVDHGMMGLAAEIKDMLHGEEHIVDVFFHHATKSLSNDGTKIFIFLGQGVPVHFCKEKYGHYITRAMQVKDVYLVDNRTKKKVKL